MVRWLVRLRTEGGSVALALRRKEPSSQSASGGRAYTRTGYQMEISSTNDPARPGGCSTGIAPIALGSSSGSR
jgi:hypothetical protein